MQQHPLVAGTEPKKRRDLIGGVAVNIPQRDNCSLPLRQLHQTIRELGTTFGSHNLLLGRARPRSRPA